MDSIDSPPPPTSLSAPSAVGAPAAYSPAMSNANSNAASTIGLNQSVSSQMMMMPPSTRFPFHSMIAPLDSPYEGSHSGGVSVDSVKKKRGRPRKYAPEGGIALGLATTSAATTVASSVVAAQGDLSAVGTDSQQPKKARGRPKGSGKKQMNALDSGDIGCIPHVILANPGEDVAAKILSFSQLEQRTVFIFSANGTISNVTLRSSEASGGCVSYEGLYEIISLSGSFLVSENNGTRSRTGGLSVLLAGAGGQVLGGGVAGMLLACSQVQVIMGSFVEDDKKTNSSMLNSGLSNGVPSQMMNFDGGASVAAASPPPLGPSSGESSAENGDSPLDNRHPVVFDNNNNNNNNNQAIQMQPQLYHQVHHHIWTGSQTQQ